MRNTTNALLDELLRVKGLDSDYKLAKLFGVKQQTISSYRTGPRQLSDKMAIRATKMLGEPPAPVLAQIHSERAKDSEVAHVWREAAKLLARSGSRGAKK